jgi:superfamily I DNA/RNA helicase
MHLSTHVNATGETQGQESRIWGPPGCGKTTYLGRQINNAAQKYGGDRVMVTSFTRAAAAELVSRELPLSRNAVGTLHAHCYRALGHPEIAEAHLDEWNKKNPGYRLSRRDQTVDEMSSESPINRETGDEVYSELQILRARLISVEKWPSRVRNFRERWEAWKAGNGYRDFTDLLEISLQNFGAAPGHPAVIFVDEAQDLSPSQLQLLRKWGTKAEHFVMAGDDDQTIYTFAGAAPEVLLCHIIPERFRHLLAQSYRVPRAVHRLTQRWIEQVAVREPKEYRPRDADGEVRLLRRGNYRHPEVILDDAVKYMADGKTVMLLTTCSYMLEPLKAVLRKRGLPFHNPYRRKRTDWNPLYQPGRSGSKDIHDRALTAAERLMAYLRPHRGVGGEPWKHEDLVAWFAWLKGKGVLVPGALQLLQNTLAVGAVNGDGLRQLFLPAAFDRLNAAFGQEHLNTALAWFMENLKPPRRKAAEYPVRVVERGGIAALRDTPKIIVGTGHSVKGGEADVVYVFPDLSPSGTRSWEGRRTDHDAVVRIGYVMMTRARETLVICDPAGPSFMPMAPLAATVARRSQVYGGIQ